MCSNITSRQLNVTLFLVVVLNDFNPHNNDGECNSVVCINMFLYRPIYGLCISVLILLLRICCLAPLQ